MNMPSIDHSRLRGVSETFSDILEVFPGVLLPGSQLTPDACPIASDQLSRRDPAASFSSGPGGIAGHERFQPSLALFPRYFVSGHFGTRQEL